MRPAVEEVPEVRAAFEREIQEAVQSKSESRELPEAASRLTVRRRRSRPSIFQHRPGAVPEPTLRPSRPAVSAAMKEPERQREPVSMRPDPKADKAYRQRFGNYAGLAEAELSTYEALEEAPDPANSNTARTTPAVEEQTVVVPFPAPGQTRGDSEVHATIGVELRRETATFHVPVGDTSLPEAIKRLSDALQIETEDQRTDQLELALATTESEPIANSETLLLEDLSDPQDSLSADFEPPRVLRRMVD
jgi:hypothetical protein